MKRTLIPNSLFFAAIPKGFDPFLEIFQIEKKLHNVVSISSPRIDVCNKYAQRMYKRLLKVSKAGERERYDSLTKVVMAKSDVFQVISLFQVIPTWWKEMKFSEFKRFWKKLWEIKSDLNNTNLEYSRHWIPKGDKPYMRPLGAPTPEWRIQAWLINCLLDIWVTQQNGRAPWQHGGFSSKGVNTFYDQLIGGGIWRSKFIYEFDLKGYFNNISQGSILESLSSLKVPGSIYKHIEGTIAAQPTKYFLPPIEMDKAVQAYQKVQNMNFEDDWGVHSMTGEELGFIFVHSYDDVAWDDIPVEAWSSIVTFEEMDDWDRATAKATKAITLEKEYKNLMEDKTFTQRVGFKGKIELLDITDQDREKGRDNWQGLGLEGKGTPQGLSYSPLLTSICSSYYIGKQNPNIIMYMDDGIIFAETQKELDAAIATFKEGIKKMGVEIQDAKSGIVKSNGIWEKDLKIVGFKIDLLTNWLFSCTRSGTVKPIPFPKDTETLKRFEQETLEKLSKALKTMTRTEGSKPGAIKEWIRQFISKEGIQPSELISIRGVTGAILSHIWNPEEMKGEVDRITEGLSKARAALTNKKYTFLMDRIPRYKIDLIQDNLKPINSLSTEIGESLMEWLERSRMNSARNKNKNKVNKTMEFIWKDMNMTKKDLKNKN